MAKFMAERYMHNTQIQQSMVSGVLNASTIDFKFLADTTVAAGDFIMFAQLPERAAVLSMELVTSALGTAITGDLGLMNEGETDVEYKFIDVTTMAAAKWFKVGDNLLEGRLNKVQNNPKTIALKIKAGGVIPKGAVISVTPYYRHANNDE